jgi:3-isopropylmalate dehydrogenase
MTRTVTLLPGDGIGQEVMAAAVQVMHQAAKKADLAIKTVEKPIGGISIDEYDIPLTDDTIQMCRQADAVLLGAVGGPKWEKLEHHRKPEAGLLKIRKALDLFANIRPAQIYSDFLEASPIKREILEGTDFIVLRELTGGLYFGEPRGYNRDKGWNTMIYTKPEVERIARMAFQMARQRKQRVLSVDKANVLECSQFWRTVVEEVHRDFSDIELKHMYVDNAAMQIVRDPRQFDVLLTSNLFGDILSDIAGSITGSLGMLPSASLGTKYALYEPVHGSAPDIAGKDLANPIAMISSVGMMFNYSFQLPQVADWINEGIKRTLAEGYRTKDICTSADTQVSTTRMTELILKNLG